MKRCNSFDQVLELEFMLNYKYCIPMHDELLHIDLFLSSTHIFVITMY